MFDKFKCCYCGKFTLYSKRPLTDDHNKVISRLCKKCDIEETAAWEQFRSWEEAESLRAEQDYWHMEAILDSFCDVYACWGPIDQCPKHDLCPDCGAHYTNCRGLCDYDSSMAYMDDVYDEPELEEDDHHDHEDICACGEPVGIGCVCAELKSLARHNADPATRGSWWVA